VLASVALGVALQAAAPWDAEVARGFDHFYNLELDEAVEVFQALARRRRDSPDLQNYVAQALLYRHLLHTGALETELVTGGNAFLRRPKTNPTPEEQRRFDDAINTSIRLTQAELQRNAASKMALYYQGVAYGLRANYSFLVRKAWLDSLRDATTSRKLHNRVTEIDPAFADARLTQGAHDYVVGSLPWTWKMLGFLVGFRGDKEQGIRTLEMVYQKGQRNRIDAAVLLATIYRRERRAGAAVPLLESLIREFPRNYLSRLELAQMYSDLGDKKKALEAIGAVERLKSAGSPGFASLPTEKIFYFRATVQFWYGDLDDALANFLQVTAKADELDPNTGVTAWMRLGQTYDLKGQRKQAVEAYRKAIAYAPGSYRAKESEDYLRRPFRRAEAAPYRRQGA
jgi:tetratricopeptide (TPR) repeat protein